MIVKLKRKATPEQERVVYAFGTQGPNGDGPWSAAKLYGKGEDGRRVTFLELMAWAINSIESIETRKEWEAFTAQLKETRERVWGERPWPGATDDAKFQAHVKHMAHVFANSHTDTGVKYERRKTNPLGESS
jgi:hypothetical protein